MAAAGIRVKGLRELRKAFKAAGSKDLDKHLKTAHVKIAKVILDKARPGLAAQSTSVAASARVINSAAAARIKVDNVRAGGTIFGAHQNQPRIGPSGRRFVGYNQFRPVARDMPYHIFPEADEVLEPIADEYEKALVAFLDEQGVPRG